MNRIFAAAVSALILSLMIWFAPAHAQSFQPMPTTNPWLMQGKLSAPINVTTSSAPTQLPVPGGLTAWLYNSGSSDAYYTLGTSNAVTTTKPTGSLVKSGGCVTVPLSVGWLPNSTWIAIIGDGGTTTVYVETGVGSPPQCAISSGGGGGGTVTQGNAGSNAQAWWVRLGDGTNGPASIKPASTAAAQTDLALVVRNSDLGSATDHSACANATTADCTTNQLLRSNLLTTPSVTQGTTPWLVGVTQWGGVVLGAASNYGTSPGTVAAPGVNAFVTNSPAISNLPTTADTNIGIAGASTIRVIPASNTPALPHIPTAGTTGAATPSSAVAVNSNNATNLKNGAGTVYGVQAFNINASTAYWLKLYDKATTPTCGTDTPVARFLIPPTNSGVSISLPVGKKFSNGIGFCTVQGIADNDNTSVPAATVAYNIDWN